MMKMETQTEIGRIIEKLSGVMASLQQLGVPMDAMDDLPATADQGVDRMERLTEVRTLMRLRDIRASLFDNDLVGEHAWNMLLFCYYESLSGEHPTVSAVCAASHAPSTTASRHLQAMIDAGMLQRHLDPSDARRSYVMLAPESELLMRRYFDMARAIQAPSLFAVKTVSGAIPVNDQRFAG